MTPLRDHPFLVGLREGIGGSMKCYFVISSLFLLAACGVPSDPEKGPVILLCEGNHYLKSGDGTVERQKLTQFYKVDGVEGSLETWDDEKQQWMGSPSRITITPNQITRHDEPMELAGIASSKSITIDRVAARVHDQFSMSNGGITTFDGTCKPVKSPTSEKKF